MPTDWALVTQQEEEKRATTRYPTGSECQCPNCKLFFSSEYPFMLHQHWEKGILVCLPPESVGLQQRTRKAGITWVSGDDGRPWSGPETPHSAESRASERAFRIESAAPRPDLPCGSAKEWRNPLG